MVSEQDCRRIAAEASIDVRTVRRVFEGEPPRSAATLAAIEAAADRLGIKTAKQEARKAVRKCK